MNAIQSLVPKFGKKKACNLLGFPRSSFYRWLANQCPKPLQHTPKSRPPLALSKHERQVVLDILHSEEFIDRAPPSIYARLLDQGRYLCSIRTMYRILQAEGELRERRNQCIRPHYQKPELMATGPNQLWSWDITKLKGPAKWTYFHLYVILDVFSRYVVGWMISTQECSQLAKQLISQSCSKHRIAPRQLTIHADRGPSMTSKTLAALLGDLEVTKTHNRPYTSNDNPVSESQFKTLKYRPTFPERFGSLPDARAHCRHFFRWYNKEHYHRGISLLYPHSVHFGLADAILEQRHQVLLDAFHAFPQRFKGHQPKAPQLPSAVWINPPQHSISDTAIAQ